MDEQPTPVDADIPRGWVETPSSFEARQLRRERGQSHDDFAEATPTPRAYRPAASSYFDSTASPTLVGLATTSQEQSVLAGSSTRLIRGGPFGNISNEATVRETVTSDGHTTHPPAGAAVRAPRRNGSDDSIILGT